MKVREQINNPRFEDSLTRFEACERRLDEMEGQLESWELGDLTLRDEINALEEDTHMDEELAALKARMQSASQAQSSATAS